MSASVSDRGLSPEPLALTWLGVWLQPLSQKHSLNVAVAIMTEKRISIQHQYSHSCP